MKRYKGKENTYLRSEAKKEGWFHRQTACPQKAQGESSQSKDAVVAKRQAGRRCSSGSDGCRGSVSKCEREQGGAGDG